MRARLEAYAPLLLAFAIPFPIRVFTPIAIVCLSFTFLNSLQKKTIEWRVLKTPLFIISSLTFLLLVIGLSYSNNFRAGRIDLERCVMVIVMPFIIYQWKNENITSKALVLAFIAGTLMLTLYAFVSAFFVLSSEELSQMFANGHSFYTGQIGLHPSYLGIFLIFSFFYLVEFYRKHSSTFSKADLMKMVGLLVYIIALVVFIRARSSLAILVIILLFYGFLIMPDLRKRAIIGIGVLLLVIIGYFSFDYEQMASGFGRNALWAVDDRFAIWTSAWEGYKLSPVIGGGTGGEQFLIDEGFLKTGYDYGMDSRYNAHNQYLQNLCRNGILDLALLLILCFYSYRHAIKERRLVFLMFLLIVTFAMVSETFLGKQKGVAFFFFFLSAYWYLKDE